VISIKDLTITARAQLLDTVPMATTDRPDREFLPEEISVKYWPTPDGWRVWSLIVRGHAVLKSGEIGKSERHAFYGGRLGTDDAPHWAREFAAAHTPAGDR
jgi:hypothetical protein